MRYARCWSSNLHISNGSLISEPSPMSSGQFGCASRHIWPFAVNCSLLTDMNTLQLLSQLIGQYGLYAVFFLVMIEGDITLLLAGVLAHSAFFGEYGFARILLWGTLGGCLSDNVAYLAGRAFCESVRQFRFYRVAKPRIEQLTNKFGSLSIFLSKYIYGLRWASCVFYGVGR